MQVNLKASTLKKCHRLSLSPSWVSNGYWAIKLTSVENAAMFVNTDVAASFSGAQVGTLSDDKIEAVLPKGPFYQLVDTGLSYVNARERVRIFAGPNGYQGFRESILAPIGLLDRTLYQAKDGGPVVDSPEAEEITACAMPCDIGGVGVLDYLAPKSMAVAS